MTGISYVIARTDASRQAELLSDRRVPNMTGLIHSDFGSTRLAIRLILAFPSRPYSIQLIDQHGRTPTAGEQI